MIQRIQSVYLLITAIIMAVTVFSPFVGLQDLSVLYLLNGLGTYASSVPGDLNYLLWVAMAFSALSALIAFISVFFYKNRKKQIKMCKTNSLVIILFYIILAIYLFLIKDTISIELGSFKYGVILPLIAFIFNLLATSKIKADEKLVQSLNRIR